jgi:hypothetical protein
LSNTSPHHPAWAGGKKSPARGRAFFSVCISFYSACQAPMQRDRYPTHDDEGVMDESPILLIIIQ